MAALLSTHWPLANSVRNAPGLICQGCAQSKAPHPPLFFISVASKGLSVYVSGLESTLAGISISVDSKATYVAQKLCKMEPFVLPFLISVDSKGFRINTSVASVSVDSKET